MIGNMLIGEIKQKKTKIRFENVDDFQSYIRGIGNDYDSEVVVFTGWLYKINAREFNRKNRSQTGKGTYFRHDSVEYIGNNFYKPTNDNSFLKGFKYLTGKDYT